MNRRIPTPIRIRVPGLQAKVGLGTAVKRVTTLLGVRTCGGCQNRARLLDRRVVFVPGRGSRA